MKFKKVFKYIGIVFAALLVLLLVILIAFDWNWLRPYLNDRLSDISGRSLVIDGDIDVDLGWTTRIELEDLRFDNADWGSEPQMARVEKAEIVCWFIPTPKTSAFLRRDPHCTSSALSRTPRHSRTARPWPSGPLRPWAWGW